MHSRVHVEVHVQVYVQRCALLDVVGVHHVLGLVDQVVRKRVELYAEVALRLVRKVVVPDAQKLVVALVLDNVMALAVVIVEADAVQHVQVIVLVFVVESVRAVAIMPVMMNVLVVPLIVVDYVTLAVLAPLLVDVELAVVPHAQVIAMEVVDKIVLVDAQQAVLAGAKRELKQALHVQEPHVKVNVKAIVQADVLVVRLNAAVIVKVAAQLNARVAVAVVVPVAVAKAVAVDVAIAVGLLVITRVLHVKDVMDAVMDA